MIGANHAVNLLNNSCITVRQARMHRDGETSVVLENYQPAAHLLDALNQS